MIRTIYDYKLNNYIVRACSHSYFGNDCIQGFHTHCTFQFTYVVRGCVHIETDSKEKFTVDKGKLLFISPGKIHNCLILPENSGTIVFSIFTRCLPDDIFGGIARLVSSRTRNVCWQIAASNNKEILELYQKNKTVAGGEEMKVPRLTIYNSELLCIFGELLLEKNALPNKMFHPGVELMLKYISENYQKILTLEDMAEKVGLSVSRFVNIFKKDLGISPVKYLNRYRIDRASELLIHSNKSIEQITELCAFSSVHYFSRKFRKQTGTPPAEYRKRNRNSTLHI